MVVSGYDLALKIRVDSSGINILIFVVWISNEGTVLRAGSYLAGTNVGVIIIESDSSAVIYEDSESLLEES